MADDSMSATAIIKASAERIFLVLTDPATHAAIDGTGWVQEPVDTERLTAAGQVFRMAMYHPDHPDGIYQTANRIQFFDPPNAIAWETGTEADDGRLSFGGWVWRYDIATLGPLRTRVTHTYDWPAVLENTRQHLGGFPPFPAEHLDRSLVHLADLVSS